MEQSNGVLGVLNNDKMVSVIVIIGIVVGVFLGLLMDYYDKREYYKNFTRNLKEYRKLNNKK